jgi:hypothetical protein
VKSKRHEPELMKYGVPNIGRKSKIILKWNND